MSHSSDLARSRRSARRYADGRPRRWTPGAMTFSVSLRDTGVALGTDAQGAPFGHPLLVPDQPTRVGVAGQPELTRLLALRLLDLSCALTVLTSDPEPWRRLLAQVPDAHYEVVGQVSQWPPESSTPPWALIADSDQPPPPGFGRSPWSTVVHAPAQVPQASAWWQSAQYIVTGRAHAPAVLALRPRLDPALVARLGEEDLLSVEPSTATVFVPTVYADEARMLRAVAPARTE